MDDTTPKLQGELMAKVPGIRAEILKQLEAFGLTMLNAVACPPNYDWTRPPLTHEFKIALNVPPRYQEAVDTGIFDRIPTIVDVVVKRIVQFASRCGMASALAHQMLGHTVVNQSTFMLEFQFRVSLIVMEEVCYGSEFMQ